MRPHGGERKVFHSTAGDVGASALKGHWFIAPGARPALRVWDGEFVVHHALSNDTHRLSGVAGQLLIELIDAGGEGIPGTSDAESGQPEERHPVLLALAELGLITQC